MTWFKIDDGFYDHPKVIGLLESAAGRQAVALWTLAGTWCARHLSDGRVPHAQVGRLGFKRIHAEALVKAGLWSTAGKDFEFHNWGDYQPTKAAVRQQRKAGRERQRAWRNGANIASHDSVSHSVTSGVSHSVTDAVTDSVTNAVTNSAPTRPDLINPTRTERAPSGLASQGARACDDASEFDPPNAADAAQPDVVLGDCGDVLPARRPSNGSGAHADVVAENGATEPPRSPRPWSPSRVRTLFAKHWERAHCTVPAMGGRQVDGFAGTVARTAELQSWPDVERGFVAVLERWVAKPKGERERRSPYACFVQSWGEETSTGRKSRTSVRAEASQPGEFDCDAEELQRRVDAVARAARGGRA